MHSPEMLSFPALLICHDHPEPEPEEVVQRALLLQGRQGQGRIVVQCVGHHQDQGVLRSRGGRRGSGQRSEIEVMTSGGFQLKGSQKI